MNRIAVGSTGSISTPSATRYMPIGSALRGERGKQLMRLRGELLERPNAHLYDTGGIAPVPRCLAVQEVLSHFGRRRGPAQKKYREYMREGIGNARIWEDLMAQSLLGVEGFAESLRGHVTGKERVGAIPKGQRLVGRASLKKLFKKSGNGKTVRDRMISKAVNGHGYSQMEVAHHPKLHYSTISRLVNATRH